MFLTYLYGSCIETGLKAGKQKNTDHIIGTCSSSGPSAMCPGCCAVGTLGAFSAHTALKPAFLVECAGSDKVWACGVRLYDDRRFDAANWTGRNILGYTLMTVRNSLRGE